MPPEIPQKHRNATGSRRRAVKRRGSTGTPTPKEKRQQQPLKWQRDGRDQRQALTRARAFIPRPVVFSITKDHQETARTAAPAPMSSAPGSDRQHQSRPDHHPAEHHSRGHPSQEDSQGQGKGEESPGAACSAGRDGQRRRLPLRHPATGRRSGQAEGAESPVKWGFARELASGGAVRCFNGSLMQRGCAGMRGNLARRGSRGGSMAQGRGWFAIPRAKTEGTRWVTDRKSVV